VGEIIDLKRFRRGTRLMHGDIIHRGGELIKVIDGRELVQECDQVERDGVLLTKLKVSNREYKVSIGWIVDRPLQNGDYVLLNRQPTLHKSSMLAMQVIIMPFKTMRINLSVTKGFNADFDGDQMYELLSTLLFGQWNQVPAATTWATYDPTEDWTEALNTGLGEIDRPGDYELDQRDSASSDYYTIASQIALSGLGYLYESPTGQIGYADSTHRTEYFAANGYVDLSANDALGAGFRTVTRSGDIRNKVTIRYKKNQNQSYTDSDVASIGLYGELAQVISTTLDQAADAEDQAEFYLALRAYPQAVFDSITYQLVSPELSNTDRDALINVFMGLPLNIVDLPPNVANGEFQGFVEGWTFRAGYNTLELTLTVSPLAFSLQAFRWNSVPAVETWNTINPTLDWLNATIVA
jgi:hypothetical protein